LTELRDLYRASEIDETTPLFAVLGNPIAHSKSPQLHNTAYRRAGIPGCFFRLLLDDPTLLKEIFDTLDLRGAAVTVPHKEALLPQLDEVEPAAAQVGAINTVLRSPTRSLCGFNTDIDGLSQALAEVPAGSHALVLGAGGTARAATLVLLRRNAHVTVASRTMARTQKLAVDFDVKVIPWERVARERPELLIHATPIGMEPHVDESPVPDDFCRPGMCVLDCVYTPAETKLLAAARRAGAKVVPGTLLFEAQGRRQFELMTGVPYPS
jgi:shikimate dehydrogenase